MAGYTKSELAEHLASLGLIGGDDIIVHSRLISFGRIENGTAGVLETIQGIIGDTGTIVVPAYTLHLTKQDIFDPGVTPSKMVGAFSEHVRQMPGAFRSRCPIHSHAAVGPKADILRESLPGSTLGPGSDFDTLHRHRFKLLLLGCTFHEGATFIHHVESMVGVPYRSWMDLPRTLRKPDGGEEAMLVRHYGKDRDDNRENRLHLVENRMNSKQLTRSAAVKNGGRNSYLMTLDNLYICVRDLINLDPCALVTDEPHVS